MLIKLGGRLKISVEELESIDGGTSVYRDTARNEMCVKIKISVFLYFYIFLQNAGERARTQQERKAMWQPYLAIQSCMKSPMQLTNSWGLKEKIMAKIQEKSQNHVCAF
jgi:hypothetical protein